MKTKEHIEQLKAIPITHYLSEQGLQPVKVKGTELIYYSPKNEEHTPSFFVNPQKNVFHDYSGVGEQGDIIRLIQYLNGCSFMQALNALEAFKPENPFLLAVIITLRLSNHRL
ncbi:CHC2 zinc finger domain-containing protein [Spirosoma pulveris]